MSAISGPPETTGEELQYIDRASLSHEEAATLLNDALKQLNEQFVHDSRGFQVVYYGQPHLGTIGGESPKTIDPTLPVDLALDNGTTLEPIDIIDVVKFVGYDPSKGRLTTGFMATNDLAQAIQAKIEQHLASKENARVLISPVSGTKYNVEQLTGHTLAIDPQNYLCLDGYRIAYFIDDKNEKPKALSASSLRSSGVMQVGPEFNSRVYTYESTDLAPQFYFDLSKLVSLAKEHFPNAQQADLGNKDDYYVLRRDPGKI